jgi:glutamate dehydrogenase
VTEEGRKVAFRSLDGRKVTFISPGGGNNELIEILEQLKGEEILNARMYVSKDGRLRLDSFVLGSQERVDTELPIFRAAVNKMREKDLLPEIELAGFDGFMASATSDCVEKFDPYRAKRHFKTYEQVSGCDCVVVTLEPEAYPGLTRITISMTTPPGRGSLLETFSILDRYGVEVERAYADVYDVPGEPFAVCSVYCTRDGEPIREDAPYWPRLKEDLEIVKWYERHELSRFVDERGWSLKQVTFVQSACEFAHQFLLRSDLYAYTAHNVVRAVTRNPEIAEALLGYFEARFDPYDLERRKRSRDILADLRRMIEDVTDDVSRIVLECMEVFISHAVRTNYFLEERFGLAFRMDPAVLDHIPARHGKLPEEEKPYGFYFFHGPHFLGFHVRYRETSRGGVRVVPTRKQEIFEIESNRLFDEVTALARSQQYKNKDIPEGGSKAVLLLGPDGNIDLAVKSMVNSLLDVILSPEDTSKGYTLPGVVDYLGRQELIYLGPDEHITTAHIEWIVNRAKQRGYKWASAFMSSKPKTGINHKQYGVTSRGVVVFAEEVLKHLGVDPFSEPFSVKLTGGPAGDVAGNAIKVLFADYGDNVRIVAVSDGSGAALDPDGLDRDELLRLVEAEKDIAEFDTSMLKGRSAHVTATDTPEGVRVRDTLHNKAKADLFIPAGGRPDTINIKNWRDYLDENGRPTSRAIVEGANIFLSQPARDKLEELGLIIVHGASANKTGVICSSYEILAGLMLSDEEFLEIKDRYVAEVLDILKERARDEARLLLKEYRASGGRRPLTSISLELSREINQLADVIRETLEADVGQLKEDPEFFALAMGYCPPIVAERFADRFADRVPLAHQLALVSAYAAARMVYSEGLDWPGRIAEVREMSEVVRAYIREEKKLAAYVLSLRESGIAESEEIAQVLLSAGRRYMTGKALGLE